MSSQVTDWGRGQLLAVWLNQAPAPAEFFVALCAGEPGTGIDGTSLAGLEPSGLGVGSGYARARVPAGAAWSDPAGQGTSATLVPLDFGVPIQDWGTIAYYALCTALVGGNVWCYGEFDVPGHGLPTFDVTIPAGALVLQVASLDATIVAS